MYPIRPPLNSSHLHQPYFQIKSSETLSVRTPTRECGEDPLNPLKAPFFRHGLGMDFPLYFLFFFFPLLSFKLQIYKAFLEMNNPGTYTVQVRARDATFSHYKPWGPWSVPQHFGEWEGPSCLFQLLGAPDVPGLVTASLPSVMVCPSCSMALRQARGDGYRQHSELQDKPFNAVKK